MKLYGLILAVALVPATAFAADRQFVKGEPVVMQLDQGYILVRTNPSPGGMMRGTLQFAPLLVRALGKEELERADAQAKATPDDWADKVESNVVEPLADHPYAEDKGLTFLVTSLKPGTYVIAGMAVTNWAMKSSGVVLASLSMGTVKFEVKPGVLTDLGTLLAARDDLPTDIPELSKMVSAKRLGFSSLAYDLALQPATATTPVPAKLQTLPIVPADYQAVESHPNYLGAPLGRLAPVLGVLDYDKDGNVIDLKTAAK